MDLKTNVVVRSGARFGINCCRGLWDVLKKIKEAIWNHKCVTAATIIFVLLFSFPITTLIMSTGRIWKCPGEPRAFSWLLGFSITGFVYNWYLIVMMFQHILCGEVYNKTLSVGATTLLTLACLLFTAIWFFVSFDWGSFPSITNTTYYVRGQNMYCDPLIPNLMSVLPWICVLQIVIPMIVGICVAIKLGICKKQDSDG